MTDDLRRVLAALTEGEGITPGPWHAVRASGMPEVWWLENEAGDSTVPDPEDMAAFVNALPALLGRIAALEKVVEAAEAGRHDVGFLLSLIASGEHLRASDAEAITLRALTTSAALADLDKPEAGK